MNVQKKPDMTSAKRYPGFDYDSSQLAKFRAAANLFTILLTSGSIIHFVPDDTDAFHKWLLENDIQDMRKQEAATVRKNK